MAFHSHRRLFHTPNKPMQYTLAFLALLVVLALVACWAIIRHNLDAMQSSSSDDDDTSLPTIAFTKEDKGNLLCIIADEQDARFYLVQSDPANTAVYILPIPQNLTAVDTKTVLTLYREAGASKTTAAIADMLNLPLKHYLTITPTNAAKWLGRARDGVHLTLTDSITYTDENEQTTVIPSGQLAATASQSAILLHHSDDTGALVLTALINEYMTAKRYLMTDFAELCNRVTQTSLRIDNFTDYRAALSHLAEQNTGELATTLTIPTTTDDNTVRINHRAIKKLAIYD